MSAIERYSSGGRWEPIVGYSRAVRAGNHVYVAGCTGVGPDGVPVAPDAGAQATQALANIAAALERAEASLEQVVQTRMYVVDIARHWESVGRAHGAVFAGHPPASAMLGVAALIDPALLVEIEAIAYLG